VQGGSTVAQDAGSIAAPQRLPSSRLAGWQAGRLAGWQAGRLAGWQASMSRPPEPPPCASPRALSLPLVPPARYLLLSIGEGCEPANRVYIVDLTALDKGPDGSPDYPAYEFYSGAKKLPIMKLIDNFEVGSRASGWQGCRAAEGQGSRAASVAMMWLCT
jgi:hypothetical protein